MSSVYLPRPVMKRLSSLRTTRAPMPSTPMDSSLFLFVPFPWGRVIFLFRGYPGAAVHLAGGGEDRLDDIVVARAAADIAFQLVADRLLVEIAAVAADHVDGGH